MAIIAIYIYFFQFYSFWYHFTNIIPINHIAGIYCAPPMLNNISKTSSGGKHLWPHAGKHLKKTSDQVVENISDRTLENIKKNIWPSCGKHFWSHAGKHSRKHLTRRWKTFLTARWKTFKKNIWPSFLIARWKTLKKTSDQAVENICNRTLANILKNIWPSGGKHL